MHLNNPSNESDLWSGYELHGYSPPLRFQGRETEPGIWYVHVSTLKEQGWVRLTHGYFYGRSLIQASHSILSMLLEDEP